MPHRDPETGQFMADQDQFEDIEVVSFAAGAGVEAADLTGTTGFNGEAFEYEGIEVLDYDEVVDRNEELHLLYAAHVIRVFQNSTTTADGVVEAGVEVSASPARSNQSSTGTGTATVQGSVVGGPRSTNDSIDLIGRPMRGVAFSPFSDGASGVGGSGGNGEDSWQGTEFPAEFGRFHPRDELFMNGQIRAWNIADAGVHVQLNGQHVYGVVHD